MVTFELRYLTEILNRVKWVDKQKEIEEQNLRKRQRMDRIRREYLLEMRERREQQINRNSDHDSNNISHKTNTATQDTELMLSNDPDMHSETKR